ncbi:hypothetical protein [Pseudooceanicola sp.]|uniref:hypothetical protein n=1 Tax=Pseudooceanicola sp. TaxID=1914328 RepID=UPI0035C70436
MSLLRRHIWAWVLSLLIVLTGQAAAVAHAAPGPSGQVELCTGSGPVMVYVDAEGQPTGAPVYCPDFALSLILALDTPGALALPVDLAISILRARPISITARSLDLPGALARGPPSVI